MGREYDIEKNSTARLPLSYGNLPVRGTLVRHETMAVGSDLQVTLQSALGEGEWDGIDSLGYAGAIIAPQYYSFHPGAPGETAADSFFPNDVDHPDAAFINVRLPIGMATDNDPDKLVGNYRCRKINNYDANGNVTGYGFSRNPARIAADVIKNIRPRLLARIDWASWVEWRDWCDVLINTTVDGQTVQVKRFELNLHFDFPFDLEEKIDLLCQLSCTDYQWSGGKLRFMCPIDRAEETFTFDLSQVSENDYKFFPTDRTNRPNMVLVKWRNFNDPYYIEEDPIPVKRDTLITQDGSQNPLIINTGICPKNQAERLGHFWAKMRCDATEFCAITGSWDSYPMLPGDVINFTHDIPDYTDRRFKIIEKEEYESEGLGYQYKLQDIPANAYSDTDQTPLVLHPPSDNPNPFAAPPLATLTLQQDSVLTGADGATSQSVIGTVQFGSFGFGQMGKGYWIKPGGEYEFLTDITPDANGYGYFKVFNAPQGVNWFKVVTFSELGVANTNLSTQNQKSINLSSSTFFVDGYPVNAAIFRALTALDPNGKYIGRDTTVIPVSAIEAKIDSAEIVSGNVWCVISVNLKELTGQHNQADSANTVQVDVFDQFGNFVKSFAPAAVTLKSATAVSSFSRKYADPKEGQAYFRIKVANNFGWSNVVYLQGNSISNNPPAAKSYEQCPKDFSAAAISSSAIQISYQSSNAVNLYRRLIGEPIWTLHQAGLSASSPQTVGGFAEITDYELKLAKQSDTAQISNIVRVRTKQQNEPAPSRPAPTAPSGAPDATTPTSKLNFSCISSANVETEVFVDGSLATTLAAVAVGETINYSISELAANTSRTVKFRHKWGAGDYSNFTNEVTATTANPPPADQPPEITSASYDTADQKAVVNFAEHGGSANFTVDYNLDNAGWVRLYTDSVPANATNFEHSIVQTGAEQRIKYRIARHGSSFGNEFELVIPQWQNALPPHQLEGNYDGVSAVQLTWVNRGGDGTFTIKRGLNGLSFLTLSSNAGSLDFYTDEAVSGGSFGRTYYYKVIDNDISGESEVISVFVPGSEI